MLTKDMKILVTGADGFIGSHLVENLVQQGFQVKAFTFYNSFGSWGWLDTLKPEVLANIEVVQGDIRDPHGVRQAIKGCQAVFHLAALIAIPFSYHAPDAYVDTNIKGTLNVLQAVRDLNLDLMIQTSTSEVYGTAQFVPITELHPLHGQSPYAATKIGSDQLAMSFYDSFQTPVAIVRPFNTYGPRQSARAIIPTIITQVAAGKKVLKLGDLSPTRDFNFVNDTALGFIAAGKSDKSIGQVINIGSNFEISVGDTLKMILNIMGKNVDVVTETQRLRPSGSEVGRLWADNTKAKTLLGWEPQYGGANGFRRGLQETIEWFTNSENLKRYKTDIYNL